MIPQQVAVIDTETTGVDPKTCKVCEIALFNPDFNVAWSTLVDPEMPIPPETSAIHHICDHDVKGFSTWPNAKIWVQDIMRENNITLLAAHNADFDAAFVGIPDSVWICTYKCALRQWPDAPSFKNEALKYWLELGDRGRNFNHAAHSALHDCKTTALILEELLKYQTLETLLQWSKEPKMFTKIAFGKHVGKKWEEIDLGYLQWICKQPDMDIDIKACAAREIQRRR